MALLVCAAKAFAVATIVKVADEFPASEPMLHTPVPELYVPAEVDDDTKVRPLGSRSFTLTLVAVL